MQIIKTVSKELIATIEEGAHPARVVITAGLGFFALAAMTLKNMLKPTAADSVYDVAEARAKRQASLTKKKITLLKAESKELDTMSNF